VRRISAREANQTFPPALADAKAGEEVVATRHGKTVAVPRVHDAMPAGEREAAVEHALRVVADAPRLGAARRFSREEVHDR
jgi:antitoxin (DNA-binding transcriptional repressor) of toxin-antitoxin stability system